MHVKCSNINNTSRCKAQDHRHNSLLSQQYGSWLGVFSWSLYCYYRARTSSAGCPPVRQPCLDQAQMDSVRVRKAVLHSVSMKFTHNLQGRSWRRGRKWRVANVVIWTWCWEGLFPPGRTSQASVWWRQEYRAGNVKAASCLFASWLTHCRNVLVVGRWTQKHGSNVNPCLTWKKNFHADRLQFSKQDFIWREERSDSCPKDGWKLWGRK